MISFIYRSPQVSQSTGADLRSTVPCQRPEWTVAQIQDSGCEAIRTLRLLLGSPIHRNWLLIASWKQAGGQTEGGIEITLWFNAEDFRQKMSMILYSHNEWAERKKPSVKGVQQDMIPIDLFCLAFFCFLYFLDDIFTDHGLI